MKLPRMDFVPLANARLVSSIPRLSTSWPTPQHCFQCNPTKWSVLTKVITFAYRCDNDGNGHRQGLGRLRGQPLDDDGVGERLDEVHGAGELVGVAQVHGEQRLARRAHVFCQELEEHKAHANGKHR